MPRPPEAAPAIIYEEDNVVYIDGEEYQEGDGASSYLVYTALLS